ncbi:putative transcriptional elongation protein Spt4 [Aureobasidium pullulans]|nr:putative transcriptional elongation protein Spt4 [Aureobasidium pullulans]
MVGLSHSAPLPSLSHTLTYIIMSNFVPPSQHRSLRACMVCSIVLPGSRFRREGCPNCEEFLELAGHDDTIQECTSQVFEGLITLADPSSSWVARWQRLDSYVAGVYAVKVTGILPEEVISTVEAAGVKYIPRDGTNIDDM